MSAPEPARAGPPPAIASREFEEFLAANQQPLLAYVLSLVGTGADAFDILQDTNVFLWEHRHKFVPGTSFKAWACRVAYFKTLAFRRDQQRRGEEFFREDILLHLAQEAPGSLAEGSERLDALLECLQSLKPADRQLLTIRYSSPASLADFALRNGRSASAVHTAICRIRGLLRQCVERRLRQLP